MGQLSYKNRKLLESLMNHQMIQKMHHYNHHGNVTTFDHSVNVVCLSCLFANKFHLNDSQIENIIIGGMLHDFYLYDYHGNRIRKNGIHAWTHPKTALTNALKHFKLNHKQHNIIRSHMYPVCFLHPPKCIEAWIIVLADKCCAISEYFYDSVLHRQFKINNVL